MVLLTLNSYVADATPPESAVNNTSVPEQKTRLETDGEILATGGASRSTLIIPESAKQELAKAVLYTRTNTSSLSEGFKAKKVEEVSRD